MKKPRGRCFHFAALLDENGNPINAKWSVPNVCCAERRILQDYETLPSKSTIVVVQYRVRRRSVSIGRSEPCDKCRIAMINAGVERVIYSTRNDGKVEMCSACPTDLKPSGYSALF